MILIGTLRAPDQAEHGEGIALPQWGRTPLFVEFRSPPGAEREKKGVPEGTPSCGVLHRTDFSLLHRPNACWRVITHRGGDIQRNDAIVADPGQPRGVRIVDEQILGHIFVRVARLERIRRERG